MKYISYLLSIHIVRRPAVLSLLQADALCIMAPPGFYSHIGHVGRLSADISTEQGHFSVPALFQYFTHGTNIRHITWAKSACIFLISQ